jgi:sugar phosphate permease
VLAITDMSAYWFTYSWMPKYLYDQLGYSRVRSGIWMLVTQAGGLVGCLSFGVVADTFGRRIAHSIYSAVWAVGLLAITLVAGRYGLGGGISLAALFAVATGLWVWTLPETRGTHIGEAAETPA